MKGRGEAAIGTLCGHASAPSSSPDELMMEMRAIRNSSSPVRPIIEKERRPQRAP